MSDAVVFKHQLPTLTLQTTIHSFKLSFLSNYNYNSNRKTPKPTTFLFPTLNSQIYPFPSMASPSVAIPSTTDSPPHPIDPSSYSVDRNHSSNSSPNLFADAENQVQYSFFFFFFISHSSNFAIFSYIIVRILLPLQLIFQLHNQFVIRGVYN